MHGENPKLIEVGVQIHSQAAKSPGEKNGTQSI